MFIKSIVSAAVAALLMTGAVSGPGTQLPQPTKTAATGLTEEQAVAIALEHAGVTEPGQLTVRMDRDDGQDHWDIQWRSGDWTYDYDIHPDTGAVLEADRDYEPVRKAQTQTEQPKTEATTPAESVLLTPDQALAIALDHAGLTRDQITRLEREQDRDDRRPKWEIEFHHDGWEYSYEIHAETGKILDWEKDWDD